ncbi:ATP-dependent DNA helicase [Aeromicrobium chenweiae]|uniref:ATP-dependent helicase DinG n=1 Tax=Aeromicrobium chenweiae TaxID=2079793 RepID=A0A2S0WMX7_9ACTN|nr:ATP-dependent DNA helicase [Aeromicrobium chenweiae]AWB92698.1 ATP-dependent helicase [Aeromicrobium chenweiae]TGN33689.1 ATP-dependent DNA helicase [Aeromicrobium chenweiae]
MPSAKIRDVLHAAVEAVGGADRPGQIEMAEAVKKALDSREHLLVQAGTGTGKSLGYLVPSLLHGKRVIVATATLNLQHQLVERDIPALKEAARATMDKVPHHAVVKGRSNYACLHRVREGAPDDQGTLIDVPEGSLGAEVLELREWAEEQATGSHTGDRDSAPSHTERAWRQVSVNHRECLGASRCAHALQCFAELAREDAHNAQVVVTNHSLLAIDAIDGVPMLPEYDAVVVDEAHELAARVTQASTDELDPSIVERAARRARAQVDGHEADDLSDAADALADVLARTEEGRIDVPPQPLQEVLAFVRDNARACLSAFPKEKDKGEPDAAKLQARGMVDDVRKIAERMAAKGETEVLWVTDNRRGEKQLHIAPIDVSWALREKLFGDKTVILTSATLKLGGGFEPVARSLGLWGDDPPWTALDVGSPFDYRKQGVLYVARDLPAPGRDGLEEAQLAEITSLIEAAGGRTLGLFSSRRGAEKAAEEVRERLPDIDIWCQGDAQLPELARRFAETPSTCLFGTLSLWQGVDLPGDTCQLVIIDRIPFPRPDDPLMSARQRLVEKRGGNGFMTVAANHAALLLAQGTGRLIRRSTDKGVVAILDPRIVTARYGSFLAASLPDMWRTTDREVALAALRRLDDAANASAESVR